ncbi:MFS transporter [Sorangium cellulosum]|uniref:MFS transporter n=1 Tax=Sorangium cellulosum TaxID=56 RepID=A0A4P2Q0Y2_SORCE|nr:MFS transporter [Sorangium cellulosum]AUX22588.1 MFS transporter [Sorangium cellulosum]
MTASSPVAPARQGTVTRVRWTICALLFFATTINYLDRQLFSLLIPFFEDDLRLGPTDLALINVSFLLAYGFGMVFVGRWIDRIGTGKGLSATFLLWNVASAAHAAVGSFAGFAGVRFLLGVGEAGNFPSAVRTVAEWFPKKERALATGLFNCGSNVGAILAPLLAVRIAEAYGWRTCFLLLGGIGVVWIFFWNRLYRRPEEHPKVSPEELAHIRSDAKESTESLGVGEVFGMRPVYAVATAKFFTDAPWWFYLTWLPKFLVSEFNLKPTFMAYAIPVVFLVADGGAVGGGWLSSRLIAGGRSVGAARKLAMLVCALSAVPVMAVGQLVGVPSVAGIPTVFVAVAILSLAAAAHQGWSSNLYTLVSDALPRPAMATVVGVMTAFGVVGGALFQIFVGWSLKITGSYALPFLLAGTLYLIGLLALHLVLPRVEPVTPKRSVPKAAIVAGGAVMLASIAGLQFALNRPPYASVADYRATRSAQLGATGAPTEGPAARVGWMDARWYLWPTAEGTKVELIKLDRDARPVVEPRGASAKGYEGPTAAQVQATEAP